MDHLKTIHNSHEANLGSSGQTNRILVINLPRERDTAWAPRIVLFDNQTFLLNCIVRDNNWSTFVTVIGGEELADKYEVKMSIPTDEDKPASISLLGKVFSADLDKEDLLQDHYGILEFNSNMAVKLGDMWDADDLEIDISYEIILR